MNSYYHKVWEHYESKACLYEGKIKQNKHIYYEYCLRTWWNDPQSDNNWKLYTTGRKKEALRSLCRCFERRIKQLNSLNDRLKSGAVFNEMIVKDVIT